MAREVGTASSQDDFISKLMTFATSNGWTQNQLDTSGNEAALNNGTVHVQFDWNETNHIGVFQSLGYTGGQSPGGHTNDSGNGGTSDSTRSMNAIGNGPFVSYQFFAGSTPTVHLYAVLEFEVGRYRFFAAGQLEKQGTWTGGEFCGCSTWSQTINIINSPANSAHNVLFDAGYSGNVLAATVHCEGLPGQDGSGKWGVVNGSGSTAGGNDGDSNPRAVLAGGVRAGAYVRTIGQMPTSLTQGHIPLLEIPIFYRDNALANDPLRLIGYVPNMRVVNLSAFQPQQEISVGADTWHLFPMSRRGFSATNTFEQSGFGGIAIKEV